VRVVANADICGAHGSCAAVDEDLFVLDEDGFIAVGEGFDVPVGKEDVAQRGVDACPLRALRLE
jgi:ferredoxin